MIVASEYERPKRWDKKVVSIEEIPDWLAELVIGGDMDPRHDQLDGVKAPDLRSPVCFSDGPARNRTL